MVEKAEEAYQPEEEAYQADHEGMRRLILDKAGGLNSCLPRNGKLNEFNWVIALTSSN